MLAINNFVGNSAVSCPHFEKRSSLLHRLNSQISTETLYICAIFCIQMASHCSGAMTTAKAIKLKPIDVTPESFDDFGQVVAASPDGEEFGPHDAQLELHHGTPRFYIMHLEGRELKFSKITHHASVTQCLGSATGEEWYLGVAKSSILEGTDIKDGGLNISTQSSCGHNYIPPHPEDVYMFRVTGSNFLKLNRGTWHAGPLFKKKSMDFYNLELSNTNVVDHTTHDFLKKDGIVFLVEDD